MKYLFAPCLMFAAGVAAAQDMPLHEIIKAGATWKTSTDAMPTQKSADYSVSPARTLSYKGKPLKIPLERPTACVLALGGSHLLVADAGERYVWAFQIQRDGSLGPGDRYCRLRVVGDERRKYATPPESFRADPSAMTSDAVNRTYVATNLGIQIFDPTGRLCGVIASPPGRVTELAFDGTQLFAHADGKVYVRKMLAEGRK